MKALISIVFMSLIMISLNCGAQTAPAVPPTPCLDNVRFAEFDFWVGEWEVHTADGTFAGTNSITRAESGCLLMEKWAGAGGSTGIDLTDLAFGDHAAVIHEDPVQYHMKLVAAAGNHHSLERERLVAGQLGNVPRFLLGGEERRFPQVIKV